MSACKSDMRWKSPAGRVCSATGPLIPSECTSRSLSVPAPREGLSDAGQEQLYLEPQILLRGRLEGGMRLDAAIGGEDQGSSPVCLRAEAERKALPWLSVVSR